MHCETARKPLLQRNSGFHHQTFTKITPVYSLGGQSKQLLCPDHYSVLTLLHYFSPFATNPILIYQDVNNILCSEQGPDFQ